MCAGQAYASTVNLTTTEVTTGQQGVSLTAPALYEGLVKTTPPDLSEFASRQTRLKNNSLPQETKDGRWIKVEERKPN